MILKDTVERTPYLTSALAGGVRTVLQEAQNLAWGWLLARHLPHTMLPDWDAGCNGRQLLQDMYDNLYYYYY